MKYCPNCGTPAEDQQAFCTNCGCKLPKKQGSGNHQETGNSRTDSDHRTDPGGGNPGSGGSNGAASGQPRQKGLATGIIIGIFAVVAAYILFFRGGGQNKKTEAPSASRQVAADSSEAAGREAGSDTAFGTDPGEGSAVSSQAGREAAGEEEVEKTPLKQGVAEGNNTFIHEEGKLVFFPHENMLWSALIAEDGSLYDFCQDATFADPVRSVAIVGTELIVGTSKVLYRTDMSSYRSGSGKMEEIVGDGVDEFSVYEGYVYYRYGYRLYRVPMQGGDKAALAEETADYEVTNQGLFVSGKNGEVYWLSYDGGEKKRLFAAGQENPYLSVGEDCLYIRYDGSREVDLYTVSTQEKGSLSLPGWTGEYAGIYPIWEVSRRLMYEGEGNTAYCYDLSAGSESRAGGDFSLPAVDMAFYGDTGYWSLQKGVYWYNIVSGIKGSYEPEKDGGGSPSSGAGSVVETELFQVTVPESWAGKVTYNITKGDYQEYTLSFYQKSGQEAMEGGLLFSISLYMEGSEELEYLPSFETLGRLIYRPAEVYVVVAEYPTDVQFTPEGEAEYRALRDDVEGILDTLTVDSIYEMEYSYEGKTG